MTVFFIGMALAQYFYGPLADRFGRKPVLYAGFGIYALGAIGAVCWHRASISCWRAGSSGDRCRAPRVVSISIVRDYYSGDRMSRAMSYIMAVFVMVPILAPSIGAALITVFPWQSIFVFCVVFVAVIAGMGTACCPRRCREQDRRPIEPRAIWAATTNGPLQPHTMGYTLAMTAIFSVFTSYLASSERIFGDFYGRPDEFPVDLRGYCRRDGCRHADQRPDSSSGWEPGAWSTWCWSGTWWPVQSWQHSASWQVVTSRSGHLSSGSPCSSSVHSLLVPNLNAIAMLPMGHIAGTASAVIGTISLAVGAFFGS